MKKTFERVLVVQPQEELRSYTSSLLTDIGFRHVLQASTLTQAELILQNALATKKSIQLVVCDDTLPEGALALSPLCAAIPCMVISDAENPRNLRIAARLGVPSLIFRPYGKLQVSQAIEALLSL